jgi:hypothetical protein
MDWACRDAANPRRSFLHLACWSLIVVSWVLLQVEYPDLKSRRKLRLVFASYYLHHFEPENMPGLPPLRLLKPEIFESLHPVSLLPV